MLGNSRLDLKQTGDLAVLNNPVVYIVSLPDSAYQAHTARRKGMFMTSTSLLQPSEIIRLRTCLNRPRRTVTMSAKRYLTAYQTTNPETCKPSASVMSADTSYFCQRVVKVSQRERGEGGEGSRVVIKTTTTDIIVVMTEL